MTPDDKASDHTQKVPGPRGVGPDEFSVFVPARARRPGPGARHVLFVGVAGACVLGVGLGIWARPAMSERQVAALKPTDAAKAQPAPPVRKLDIVVDDRPAPIGKPLDVLPATTAPAPSIPAVKPMPWAPPAQPEQPKLEKAQAIAPQMPPQAPVATPRVAQPRLVPTLIALLTPRPEASRPDAPKPEVRAVATAKSVQPHVAAHVAPAHLAPAHLARTAPDPKVLAARAQATRDAAKAQRLELARAHAAKLAAHRLELAQAAKAAQATKAAKAAARQQQVDLARAEARGRAEARAEAKAEALAFAREDARKRARLAALAHAVRRMLPHEARSAPPPVEVARADARHAHKSRHDLQVERASLNTHRTRRAPEPPTHVRAAPPPPAHASGLMKVSAPRADPSLGAAERQLTRAYQDARAAGVPDAQLQHQQQRWLAARSAAAREAPWAVHDVYLARIAELNGQAREAHGDGY